jgi:hypothetical protein
MLLVAPGGGGGETTTLCARQGISRAGNRRSAGSFMRDRLAQVVIGI